MNVQGINNLSFGYKNELKTLWKKGKLPTVKVDPYGKILEKGKGSLDHIVPYSICKCTKTENVMITDIWENNKRGTRPLNECTTRENIITYFKQFIGVNVKGFIGNNYIVNALKNIRKVGFNISEKEIFGG